MYRCSRKVWFPNSSKIVSLKYFTTNQRTWILVDLIHKPEGRKPTKVLSEMSNSLSAAGLVSTGKTPLNLLQLKSSTFNWARWKKENRTGSLRELRERLKVWNRTKLESKSRKLSINLFFWSFIVTILQKEELEVMSAQLQQLKKDKVGCNKWKRIK